MNPTTLPRIDICHGCSILVEYAWAEYKEITLRTDVKYYSTSTMCEVCGAVIDTHLSKVNQ